MIKEFLPYDTVRNNALKMACQIRRDGFNPDVIYVSLRGGAYIGNVISEYFKIAGTKNRPVLYAAVVARSYTGVQDQEEIRIDGWTYNPEYLRQGDRILLVDDIFDTGRTLNFLAKVIIDRGVPRKDLKIAVHDYKYTSGVSENLPIHPDYYCRKHLVEDPRNDIWIHYLSHELMDLSAEERREYYLKKDPDLAEAFKVFEEKS
ncbi:MAG: phosphoribosyltransferase [Spirochaetales bacterium]|jgi:hypoxanthine phosphoribosyltransferase|nr:phosphoribosyltransferase [Spirochaetales bacterium]